MTKQLIALRVNDMTKRQIDELCQVLNETQTGIVTLALDRMYREEIQVKEKDNGEQTS